MANAATFNSMSGKMTGGPGAPSPAAMRLERAEAPREPSAGASIKPAVAAPAAASAPTIPKAGFYRGDGGYEYIVGPQGEITIANSPKPRGIGKVVEVDSAFYDDIAEELATKQATVSGIPENVRARLKAAQASGTRTGKAAPKGVAVADVENVEIESAMAPAAPTPMPEMTSAAYEDALLAAPQGSKVPPPPTQAPRRGSRALSGEVGAVLDALPAPIGMEGGNPNRTLSGEIGPALSGYRASARMQSAEGQALRALVDNGMDATAARAFIQRLVDVQGEQAIPLLTSLGDPKPYVPRAQR